jgi:hypothetical protein
VTVAGILEKLSQGYTIEQICNDDRLSTEQVHAALSYAEMNLHHSEQYKTLDSILRDAVPDDGLDYTLLAENAGSFNAQSCALHLIYRYKKRSNNLHISMG